MGARTCLKECFKCKEEKHLIDFYKKKASKDGHNSWCKTCQKIYIRKYYVENKDHINNCNALWAENNREKSNSIKIKWSKGNRGMVNSAAARRRAKVRKAIPSWLNDLQKSQIDVIYNKCTSYRAMGFDMHVDHIIPLQGKYVSGLHVPWNLQIVTAEYNLKKGNKYEQV